MNTSSSPNNDINTNKWTFLGQDGNVLMAMMANLLSWLVSSICPSFLPYLLPSTCHLQEIEYNNNNDNDNNDNDNTTITNHIQERTKCISIGRPGGLEQLRIVTLKDGSCTVGYNVRHFTLPPYTPPIENNNNTSLSSSNSNNNNNNNNKNTIPPDCVIIQNKYFSINYADCCIRWGLYESANQFVGFPIVPGFDVAGIIIQKGSDVTDDDFQIGDEVFGCSLFGAYSSKILIPALQLRKIPKLKLVQTTTTTIRPQLSLSQAASLPTVSLTALYALVLAGHYPQQQTKTNQFNNKYILIHSAAGGVGSMLVQMSKLLGLHVVGVVGSTTKVDTAKRLGCDYVIDKSTHDLWDKAREISPHGYKTIMDANGVSTLRQSYQHLCCTGRLIIFGFHSNLPRGKSMLSPLEWIRMGKRMNQMPQFDPMDLVTSNKSVLGFNLSFFAKEREVVSELLNQICVWIREGLLMLPPIVQMSMSEIGKAHDLIQSGLTVGKIVIDVSK